MHVDHAFDSSKQEVALRSSYGVDSDDIIKYADSSQKTRQNFYSNVDYQTFGNTTNSNQNSAGAKTTKSSLKSKPKKLVEAPKCSKPKSEFHKSSVLSKHKASPTKTSNLTPQKATPLQHSPAATTSSADRSPAKPSSPLLHPCSPLQLACKADSVKDADSPVLFLDVNFGKGNVTRIVMYESDTPEALATAFCQEHNLDESHGSKVKTKLVGIINKHLERILDQIEENSQED